MEKNTIRFRYGICLNDNCEKAKSKEVQEIPVRKEFVCPVCGKPLRECPPPKKHSQTIKVIAIAVAVAILLLGGAFAAYTLLDGNDEPEVPERHVGKCQLEWGDYAGPLDDNELPDGDGGIVIVTKDYLLIVGDGKIEVGPQDTVINCVFEKGEILAGQIRFARVEPPISNPGSDSGTEDLVSEPEDPYASWSGEWVDGQPHGQGTLTYAKHYLIDPRMAGVYAEKGDYVMGEFEKGYLVVGTLHRTDGRVQQFNNGKLPAGSPARK